METVGSMSAKVGIVTGGSRGLGLAVARAFLREGGSVVITGRDAAALEHARATLAEQHEPVLAVVGDVSSEASVAETFEKAIDRFGRVDSVVNNAGVALVQPVHETSLADWDRMLAVHATGSFLVSREAVRRMVAARIRGRIVNISSILGSTGAALACAYSAAKAALLGLTRALAKEVATHGITVNAVLPGAMDTRLFHRDTIDVLASRLKADRETLLKHTLAAIPMKRLLDPGEVADLVLYLCSDRAGGITGQSLPITCGFDIH
ncbi:MAG: SDR family oxidoreductase [Candidatus Riflebacteria bacterium]|nr:SDR family oxidoreductase [Candidatus Riflebacteria bacterium]